MGSSPTRGSSFFLGKVTTLGVLCCFALFVCLTLLASFFLPCHLSFKNMYIYLTIGVDSVGVAHLLFRNLQAFLPNDMYARNSDAVYYTHNRELLVLYCTDET